MRRLVALAAVIGLAGIFGATSPDSPPVAPTGAAIAQVAKSSDDRCDIKGNISSKGERIYHLPHQRYYHDTRISPRKGERYFCSEAEARAAGWRRSKV